MPNPKKRERKVEEGAPQWLVTYGDMTTLLLTFFILMFTTAEIDGAELRMILAAFQGLGSFRGGNTLQVGKLAELGHTIMSLPSREAGKALDKARRTAISQFQPELQTKKVRIKEDERGLIISLAADSFFEPASAEINIEESRQVLQKVATLMSSREMSGRKFRIEGHTDNVPTDPEGEWETNWELSADRAVNVLHYLVDFGVDERQCQVAGFADTVPLASNDTREGRAYNRRVDIVLLTEGHL
ncbi:MAG: flagellar motor protein MotB [Spirochaetaceae bacterium]|nr:MAG: flagellar motor protein MotB [Spirochaetaceae bacterium]